jgi:hypothetical protein
VLSELTTILIGQLLSLVVECSILIGQLLSAAVVCSILIGRDVVVDDCKVKVGCGQTMASKPENKVAKNNYVTSAI